MANDYLRLYQTPEDTLKNWVRELNHILNNLSTGGYISIGSADVKDYMIDFGVGSQQVSAGDIPILDSDAIYVSTTVETALNEVGYTLTTINTTTSLTIANKGIVLCNSGSAITVNLPTAVGNSKLRYVITNIGAGTVTIDPNGAQTIAGDSTFDLYQYESLSIYSDGSNWQEGG